MARSIKVEVVADDVQFVRGMHRASGAAKTFGTDIERVSRGAVSASLSFHGLGRAAAFASAQFLGGAGLVYGLKASIGAAEEQAQILANLRNSLSASGISWKQYGAQIEAATARTKHLSAFDDEELYKSLQLLVRGTGDVNKALRLNSLAADVARGRNMGLVAAAQLLVRVNAGQVGSLRRLGIQVDKGISGQKALLEVQRQYAGAAQAYTRSAIGAQTSLTVAIGDTEKAIGRALLPMVQKYEIKLADWLNKSENQKRVQRDVNQVMTVAGGIIRDLTSVIKGVDKVTGSFKHTLELLVGVTAAWKASSLITSFTRIGGEARGAAGGVGLLRSRLVALQALGTIGVTVYVAREFINSKIGKKLHLDYSLTDLGRDLTRGSAAPGSLSSIDPGDTRPDSSGRVARGHYKNPRGPGGSGAAGGFVNPALRQIVPGSVSGSRAGFSALTQLNLALANDPNNVDLLRKKRAYDVAATANLQKRFAEGRVSNQKYLQQITALYNDRNSVESQIASLTKSSLRKLPLKSGTGQVEAGLPGHLSGIGHWGDFSVPLSLQLGAARAGSTVGSGDDLKVAAATRRFARQAINAGRLSWQGLIDAYNTIAQQNSILGNSVKVTHRAVVSSTRLTAGIAFGSAAARREQEARIAQALAHGGAAPIHTHVYLNDREIATAVTSGQQQIGRHNATQRRGQNAGRHLP